MVPQRRIRPFPDQPRTFFDKQKLGELACSIKAVGQLVPAFVKCVQDDPDHDYELVDGQRRWHACEIAGLAEMKVIVVEVENQAQQFLISVVANFGRVEHTALETARAVKCFKDQDMSEKQVADIFARSQSWVSQYLKILKLDSAVLAMMSPEIPEESRLGFSSALLIADVPTDMQKRIADEIVSGRMKVNQSRNYIRQCATRMGIKVGDMKRTPQKDYAVFRSFVGRLKRELAMFTGMSQAFFNTMFQHRADDDRLKVIGAIEKEIQELHVLLQMLRRAKK